MFTQLKINIDEYAKGKVWYWYLPGWIFGFYIFVKLLSFKLGEPVPFIIAIPHSFNFLLHETAHTLTSFMLPVMTAAAGSFSELLLGVLLIWGAFKGKTYFASLFCFLWFMLACQSTASYMSDARAQQIPLVNFDTSGAAPIHDWNFVFGKLGLLESDMLIGGFIGLIGIFAGLAGLGFTGWLIYKMTVAEKQKALTHEEALFLHDSANAAGYNAAPTEHFEELKEGLYPTPTKGRLSETPEIPDKNSNAKKLL